MDVKPDEIILVGFLSNVVNLSVGARSPWEVKKKKESKTVKIHLNVFEYLHQNSCRIKCRQRTFQQTADTFTFICVIGCHADNSRPRVISHSDYMLHDLTFISGGGGDGGGVTGEKSAKPVTTVQDCVSTFSNLTPLDLFSKSEANNCNIIFVWLWEWSKTGKQKVLVCSLLPLVIKPMIKK